jgi:hypothetical protein
MPSHLLTRVQRLTNPRVARDVNRFEGTTHAEDVPPHPLNTLGDPANPPTTLNTHAHWAAGIGDVLDSPTSVTIHGTSGWSSYGSALNSGQLLKSLGDEWRFSTSLHRWDDSRGVGPQYTIDPNGTILPIIGPEDSDGDLRRTYHNEAMNSCSIGVEQGDFADSGAVVFPLTTNRFLIRLNESHGVTDTTEDLAGMKLYALLHPGGEEDLNLIWIALSTYTGPGDITNTHFTNWKNSLFTDRDYRSLAVLCRFLAENNSIPRNFPTLPYASRRYDHSDPEVFRQLLLGDPTCDQIANRLGIDVGLVRTGGAAWAAAYNSTAHGSSDLARWKDFFGIPTNAAGRATLPSFMGFISHFINGGHPCPGPYFDWHRFAREVCDWWWYPFDFTNVPREATTTARPYRQARGSTRLIDYYFDAVGSAADYAALRRLSPSPFGLGNYEQFPLALQVPIHSLANGVIVAACLPTGSTTGPSNGFLLTRHEIFKPDRETDTHITYDTAPTRVWSLVRFIAAPGFDIAQVSLTNPEWLNRLVMRLKECELAVAYHTAHPRLDQLNRAWDHPPIPRDPHAPPTSVPTTGQQVARDARAYRTLADDLSTGKVVTFPRDVAGEATLVRTILGDYIGKPAELGDGTFGIQIEIFSRDALPVPDRASQTVSVHTDPLWASVTAAARNEASNADDLPPEGVVWSYPLASFLNWMNQITWHHEWRKYSVLDFSRSPPVDAPTPARPNSRTSF